MKNMTTEKLIAELTRAVNAMNALNTKQNLDIVQTYADEIRDELKSRGELARAA